MFDAYTPSEIAERVENVGVAKARLPFLTMSALGLLAGGFIGLGSMFFTLITSDTSLSFGIARLLGGLVFSLGLVLVVTAGAELFTGNNLLVMAWTSRKISTLELFKNWLVVFLSNAVGAMGLAILVALSNYWSMNNGLVSAQVIRIAVAKVNLPFVDAFFKGVLCNMLVCLAVWMTLAGRTVVDKIMAILFPITAFVACGFEHSIANLYFIPLGIFAKYSASIPSGLDITNVTWLNFATSLIPVTLGNILGGSGLVALVYFVVYRREDLKKKPC